MAFSFFSCYQLVMQTYEHRSTFAHLEKLKLENEELSFQSNILIEEVKYFNNHISLRKYASENLGMVTPDLKDRVFIERRVVR
ncbi:MAG: cell division protein FtsL [Gammaproteobacteria bacterium]